jgi:hypothetical protein
MCRVRHATNAGVGSAECDAPGMALLLKDFNHGVVITRIIHDKCYNLHMQMIQLGHQCVAIGCVINDAIPYPAFQPIRDK